MYVEEVFTPDSDPSVTYVTRTDSNIEATLNILKRSPSFVVSLSGPSKSGKTVAINRVFGDYIIPVSGANVSKPDDIWHRALDWIDVPEQSVTTQHSSNSATAGGSFIAKGEVQLSDGESVTETRSRNPLADIIEEIGKSEFCIFIDDFHYIDRDVQVDVSQQIKNAFENGVNIIAASVPHRSEDLLRANTELRGRLSSIDIDYWEIEDLKKIAYQGFDNLNLEIDESSVLRIANEACGSPQLMQAICLFSCHVIGVTHDLKNKEQRTLSETEIAQALEWTTVKCNFSDLLTKLHSGPKTRGTERRVFKFTDGTSGDVYRAILLALKSGEPRLELEYSDVVDRIREVCVDGTPSGSSIAEACKQLANISEALLPGARVVDWDVDYEVLSLSDPYLLFFIRCSRKLSQLAPADGGSA